MENAAKIGFLINVDAGKTLCFRGEILVKYAELKSGGEGMNMIVRISGGVNAFFQNPFMIRKNKDSNYPIRGCSDDVPGVCYRTEPMRWIVLGDHAELGKRGKLSTRAKRSPQACFFHGQLWGIILLR